MVVHMSLLDPPFVIIRPILCHIFATHNLTHLYHFRGIDFYHVDDNIKPCWCLANTYRNTIQHFQHPKREIHDYIFWFLFLNIFLAPFVAALCQKITCRAVGMIGGILVASGAALAAVANSIPVLYVTYGCMTGQWQCGLFPRGLFGQFFFKYSKWTFIARPWRIYMRQ